LIEVVQEQRAGYHVVALRQWLAQCIGLVELNVGAGAVGLPTMPA